MNSNKIKNILFIMLATFFSDVIFSQVMWQVKNTTSKKWFLQVSDEFNEDGLNTDLWKYGFPWGNYVYNLDLLYKHENVEFNNGVVSLVTKKPAEPEPIIGENLDVEFLKKKNRFPNEKGDYTYNYSGGAFCSLRQFKYGYFEMRFKANAEKGVWPAFWLYGGGPNEEIDFYEGKGERENQIHVDVHCPKGCEDFKGGFLGLSKKSWGAWIKTSESLADGWNIISGEWQPNYVKFFLNGQPIGYFEGEFKTAQNLIINSAIAKDKEAFNPGPDSKTKFPNTVMLDYVRVWSQEDTIYNIKDKYKLFQYTPSTIANNDLYQTKPKRNVNFVYDKVLKEEEGTVTLLPVFYNKYSLSIAGKKLGKIQVDVIDRFSTKVAGFSIENTEYYIMDLSALPTGPYDIKITVLNQTLIHNVPVINPEKIGEQK